jgi:hypothetical protein
MANAWYNEGKTKLLDGSVDFLTDAIRAMLVTSGYVFDADHLVIDPGTDDADDASFNELSGTGYVQRVLASKTVTRNDSSDRAILDCADLLWTAINAGTADAMIVFYYSGSLATSVPILYVDSAGFPKATNGSDLGVTINASGLARF